MHTPWTVTLADGRRFITSVDGRDIAICLSTSATARLIAAAPDLLEALRMAVGHLTGGSIGEWADENTVLVAARQAIRKANGE